MFRNASADELRHLSQQNRFYGFAIHKAVTALLPVVDGCGVCNQPQAKTYQEGEPQALRYLWALDEMPDICDMYGWELKVTIAPDKDFDDQPVVLVRTTEIHRDKSEVWVSSGGYKMRLGAALHFLRQPQKHWEMMLPLFEVNGSESGDYIIPADELLPRRTTNSACSHDS